MAQQIQKIEVYVDDESEPASVSSTPPYRVELDASHLADGEHVLRVVASLSEGQRAERTLRFHADNFPCAIEGLADGGTVRGNVQLELSPEASLPPHVARARSYENLYVLVSAAILLGVWLYLVLSTSGKSAVAAIIEPAAAASPAQSAAAGSTRSQAEPAASGAALAAGRSVYVQHCASCHQASGEGVPGAFPPLAGNDRLANANFVIDTVIRGKTGPIVVRGQPYNGQMPALGAQLSDAQIAAVVTYVRNSFGNRFGGVSQSQVAARR